MTNNKRDALAEKHASVLGESGSAKLFRPAYVESFKAGYSARDEEVCEYLSRIKQLEMEIEQLRNRN
jgi:hypothetical protein